MGELFRSKEIHLVHIYLQLDAAHDTVDELGQLGLVQFRDLNPDVSAFQRSFIAEVKQAEELHRQYRFFQEQREKLEFVDPHVFDGVSYLEDDERPLFQQNQYHTLADLSAYFKELEGDLLHLAENQIQLDSNFYELLEMNAVLRQASIFFDNLADREADENMGFLVGAIERNKCSVFERVLWRAVRGNLFFKQVELEEPLHNFAKGQLEYKNAFVVFFQGSRSKSKLSKICESFEATLYPVPNTQQERDEILEQIRIRTLDLKMVIERTILHRKTLLQNIVLHGEAWRALILKEKGIYHTMNMFEYDVGRRCLVAEGWCPAESMDAIRFALKTGTDRSGAAVPAILSVTDTVMQRPTYNKTTDFTIAFQEIVDMYGIPRYLEVNPGIFTVITFPFLFGVMFGDVGHGFLLLLISLAVIGVWKFNKAPEVHRKFADIFKQKWLILLMSLFAIYCGFMYNECFALPMAFFPSNWTYQTEDDPLIYHDKYATRVSDNYVYPFGVDPLWKGSKNELDYANSLKMKMSIILGVTQMSFGLFLSLLNHIYFKRTRSIFCEFIPQILFLQSIFGYMCFLIILKWTINYEDPGTAPRILNLLTEMILSPWVLSDKFKFFPGQHFVQLCLLLLAGICVPWMLFSKPIVEYLRHRRDQKRKLLYLAAKGIPMVHLDEDHHHLDDEDELEESLEEPEVEPFDVTEEFIHQGIHTIEFVLGCVSNTASYLRLWALSLAHTELATVFWDRVMMIGLVSSNSFLIFICWSVWAALTVGVLLGMESLSAFLHALRLHWVEFQNKFYSGDGYKFVPFSYELILREDDV